MIRYTNIYYKLSITAEGVVSLIDLDDDEITTMAYSAEYGVTASWRKPLPEAEDDELHVRDASMLEVGDTIKIINQQLNEIIYHTAEITGITNLEANDNLIEFTPTLPVDFVIIDTNAQLTHGVVLKKTTSIINAISNPVITEDDIIGGKKIILTCDTSIADIVFNFYCIDDSPKIRAEVETTYKSTVDVFNEKLIWTFVDNTTKIFSKNRKFITSDFENIYWLGNQGCVFGVSDREVLTYNNQKCSSVELSTTSKILTFNLDDDRDHRFRRCVEFGGSNNDGIFIEQNTALYNEDESRINEFNFYIAGNFNLNCLPRIMLNPGGFLASFCWDSHADGQTTTWEKAVLYGRSDHTIGNSTSKGIVGHGIKYTHGTWISYVDNPSYIYGYSKQVYDDVINRGVEICLHCIPISFDRTTEQIDVLKLRAFPLMKTLYNIKSWSDHDYAHTIDAICSNALDNTEDAYMKDLWDGNGVKYFASAMSEDVNPDELDVLAGSVNSRRSPFYWKHPTRVGSYLIQGQSYKTTIYTGEYSEWNLHYSTTRLNKLIENWGIYVGHTYIAYNTLIENCEESDGVWVIKDAFDTLLLNLATLRDAGNLNIASKGELMTYWEKLESVTIEPQRGKSYKVNNDGISIESFSLAFEDSGECYLQGIGLLSSKTSGTARITSFDLPESDSVIISLIDDIVTGEESADIVDKINNIFESLAGYGNGIVLSEVTSVLEGGDLINCINDNIQTIITSTGITMSVDSVTIGMSGQKLKEIIDSYKRLVELS